MESRCGILCSACTYREKTGCTGCRNQQPFWGACPVRGCCEAVSYTHLDADRAAQVLREKYAL